MAKAIVFDIGGVLVGLDMGRCIRAFQEDLGFQRITELLDPCHQKGIYGDLEAGILHPDHFRDLILAESYPGKKREDVDKAMGQLLTGMREETAATVLELRERYPLYLLSNNNPISMPLCLKAMKDAGVDPEKTFKGQFVSCELKLLKPSAAFYREVVRRIGLPAGDILFIDDSAANVEGARSVGIEARQLLPGTSLASLLADC